jgi:endonuclease-8
VPEGDTIFRAARTLHRALAGDTVTRFVSVYPALTRVDASEPFAGQTVDDVRARGKHLLMRFSGGLTLHTHMRMHGSWHVYRPGERWRLPSHDMRIVLETARFAAVAFNVPVASLLSAHELAVHPVLAQLGPDLLDPGFDLAVARDRLRASGASLEEALLNQRVLAGIGNVFKSEILFAMRLNPFVPAVCVDDDTLERLLATARKLLAVNVLERADRLSIGAGRRTTGRMSPSEPLWVYGRGGQRCLKCGATIRSARTGPDARLTYWCPDCQGPKSVEPGDSPIIE